MKRRAQRLIMLAENDEEELNFLRSILKVKGFAVVEASDGRQAISLVHSEHPDLLVIDLALPRVTEAIRLLRRHANLRDLPVVTVCSTRASKWQRRLAAESSRHLTKPVEYEALCQLIDRLLSPTQMSLARV